MAASTRCLCGFLLLAPEAKIGEKVTCPRCGLAQTLPEQFDFACEACAKSVRTGTNTVGMRMACPHCAKRVFVPEPGPPRRCPFCEAPLERPGERCGACGERLRPEGGGARDLRAYLSGRPAPRIRMVETGRVDPSPFQPRERMDPVSLRKLAQSVARFGILVPVLLRPAARRFQLVAGARRLEVARRIGLARIPAVVRTLSDRDAAEIAYLDNVQREDLNPMERALGFQNIVIEHAGLPQEEISRRLGLTPDEIQGLLSDLEMPVYLRRAYVAGRLTLRQATALARLSRETGLPVDTQKVTQMVLGASLSEEETETLVRQLVAASRPGAR